MDLTEVAITSTRSRLVDVSKKLPDLEDKLLEVYLADNKVELSFPRVSTIK